MQLKTSFQVKKKSETTKIWNHDRWTDMFPHCKWYYAIIKFPGTNLVYRSTMKKQENDENWVLVSLIRSLGFPGDSDCKESTCSAGDLGSIPGLGRSPGGGHGNPLQYFLPSEPPGEPALQCSCLENLQGQRRLSCYSPWGCKYSDTAEQLGSNSKQADKPNGKHLSDLNSQGLVSMQCDNRNSTNALGTQTSVTVLFFHRSNDSN